MNSMSKMAKSLRHLLAGIVTALPLLMVTPLVSAADHQVDFSQAELDQMLAPIALYPDTILSQVLIAATYPLEVVQADRWVRSNKDLKAEDALKFAENKDWDPSVKALVAFPDILKRMSDDIDWTQKLGDAFLDDENEVMDTVQKLRKRAYASGNLDKAQHIRVEEDDNNIVIEPAEERVVYVPVYDTRVVYGNWWWPDYPPVYWNYPGYSYVSGFYWGPSIFIGANYYYSSCQWRDRRVVVVDRHYYNSAPHFYTGRSIVRFEGAREWHHDPVHRHGVAYFNESQRNNFGSHHNSYQNDREYREHFRNNQNDVRHFDNDHHDNWHGNNQPNNNQINNSSDQPRIARGYKRDDPHIPGPQANEGNNATPVDHAEQLRERMNHSNDENGIHWAGSAQHVRSVSEPVQAPANNNVQTPQRGFSAPRVENSQPQPATDRGNQGHVEFAPRVENHNETPREVHNDAPKEHAARGFKRDKDNN